MATRILRITQGDHVSDPVFSFSAGGAAADLTGCTVTLAYRLRSAAPSAGATVALSVLAPATGGQAQLTLTSLQTSAMAAGIHDGELRVTDGSGHQTTWDDLLEIHVRAPLVSA